MSCRVVSGGTSLSVQPVFATSSRTGEAKPLFRSDTLQGQEDLAPEAHRLHDRVLELEAALEREVRLARDAARQEGEAAGRERARSELQPVLEKLGKSIADLSTLRSRIRRDSESELVKLSLCIARRVLRRELTVDPEALHGLVKAALDKTQARDVRKVRVHPDFQEVVRRYVNLTGVISPSEVVADTSLEPGDVIVEARLGDVDASIDSQLKEIERGFADRLNR